MRLFDANISNSVFCFFKSKKNAMATIEEANKLLQKECGVRDFFTCDYELLQIAEELNSTYAYVACESNTEYGDFQTNQKLANQVTEKLKNNGPILECLFFVPHYHLAFHAPCKVIYNLSLKFLLNF